MIIALFDEIIAAQSPEGGFVSQVRSRPAVSSDVLTLDDVNCFVTALVLLTLGNVSDRLPTRWRNHAERALDFLEACEVPSKPGTFCFYPERLSSPRVAIPRLHPDADDTALAHLALLQYGRRSSDAARIALEMHMQPYRCGFVGGAEPGWIQPGAMRTWLIPQASENPVDCCVNANVAALYAALGLASDPGCLAACSTIEAALDATAAAPEYMRSVAPYYTHPIELLYAVQRAVACGAAPLLGAQQQLERQEWTQVDRSTGWSRNRTVCCNAHGRPLWSAPALQAARQLAAEIEQHRPLLATRI